MFPVVKFQTGNSCTECSVKKVFIEISQNSQENTFAESFLIKINFIKKETLAQVFSCKFCEIPKTSFSYKTSPVVASELESIVIL